MPALRPAIFLDRDGTLNLQVVLEGKPFPPATLAEFTLFPGVPAACAQLAAAGFVLVVATNQPDVGRGDQAQSIVEAMHARLREIVPSINHIEVCYAPGQGIPHPEDYRRKPAPGMVTDAARNLGLDLTRSWMVGDRWRDIDCGQRAGLRTVFIDFGYDEALRAAPDFTVKDFPTAAAVILRSKPLPESKSLPAPNPETRLLRKNQTMKSLADLKVQLYADGADKAGILELYAKPYIKGLTTNPSLMKKAGIKDYEAFAKDILQTVTAKPISLEVFTDDIVDMKRQALMINSWGANVYTKIPITNSKGESCLPLIKELGLLGVKLNVTALLTLAQVRGVAEALNPAVPALVSVFAGRIADTGVDPMPIMRASGALLTELPKAELLWASTREVLNLFQAEESGCAIITVPHDILAKAAKMVGFDLTALSLDTVKMFLNDSTAAGFKL